MSNKFTSYEISLWKDVPSAKMRKITDFSKLTERKVIYQYNSLEQEGKRYRFGYFLSYDENNIGKEVTILFPIVTNNTEENSNTEEDSSSGKTESFDKENAYELVSFMGEEKVGILGSNSMTHPSKSTENIFLTNINGTHTLTFSMYKYYIDPFTNEKVLNTLAAQILVESKIKLKFNDEWYDLLVKNIDEFKEDNQIKYTFTCEDAFITELARTGWEISLDETNGGMGTLDELAPKIIEGTGWKYIPTEEDEFIEKKDIYKVDENGNYIFDHNNIPEMGEEEVSVEETKYDKELDRIVTHYQTNNLTTDEKKEIGNNELWGYETNQTISSQTVKNLLYNNKNFLTTTGWSPQNAGTIITTKMEQSLDLSQEISDEELVKLDQTNKYTLEIENKTEAESFFVNDTLISSKTTIDGSSKYAMCIGYTSETNSILKVNFQTGTATGKLPNMIELTNNPLFENNITIPKSTIDNKTYVILSPNTIRSKLYTVFYTKLKDKYSIEFIELFELIPKPDDNGEDIQDNIDEVNGFQNGQTILESELKNYVLMPNDETAIGVKINSVRNYIGYDSNNELVIDPTTNEIKYYQIKTPPEEVLPVTIEGAKKVRTLQASKSNRFNLLQNLSELFEGWIKFIVKHDENGKTLLNSDGSGYDKSIQFKEVVGSENLSGFHYGVNLDTIERTINSQEIVTKLFVEQNENKYSKDGICSIQTAKDNTAKELFILDFNYYMEVGLLDGRKVIPDLYYTSESNGLKYLYALGEFNTEYSKNSEIHVGLSNQLINLNAQLETYEAQITAINEKILYLEENEKYYTVEGEENYNLLYNTYVSNRNRLTSERDTIKSQRDNFQTKVDTYKKNMEDINKNKKELNQSFFDKYSNFITEGTWNDSNYIDADEYYLDGLRVAATSSRPQISYNINVFDLRGLEGYEHFNFNVGDKTFVTDPEFFGYDSFGVPNKEEVIISEIEYNLDKPEENTITVQNYRTQFEDLFSRIAAATNTLELKDQIYSKAENFLPNGQIEPSVLQETLLNNNLILAQSKDQSVIINDKGIEVFDTYNPSSVVRIVSGGIFVSKDGGETLTAAVTANGINTQILTAGILNVEQVNLMNGTFPTFKWDAAGISSYRFDDESAVDISQLVRMDQHGLYMTKNGDLFKTTINNNELYYWWENKDSSHTHLSWTERIRTIQDNSTVSLTWNGLIIRSDNGSVNISTEGNNIIIKSAEKVEGSEDKYINETDRVILGWLDDNYVQVKEKNPNYKKENNRIGTFNNLEELNTLIETNNYLIGDYIYYLGKEELTINNIVAKPQAILIAQVNKTDENATSTINDFIIENLYSEELGTESVYGLMFLDNEKRVTLKAESDGKLWIKDALYVGISENDINTPYFGIESYGINDFDKVIWAGPKNEQEITDSGELYNFSVTNDGRLYAQGAYIEGNGIFSGTIYAENGSFSGSINAEEGYITGILGIGVTLSEDGTISNPWNFDIINRDVIEEGYDNPIDIKDSYSLPETGISNQQYYAFWAGGKSEEITEEEDIYIRNENGELILDTSKLIQNPVPEFAVTHDGQLIANNATIRGIITATSGLIEGQLAIGDNDVLLNGGSSYRIAAGPVYETGTNIISEYNFYVEANGHIRAKSLSIGNEALIEDYLIVGNKENGAAAGAIIDQIDNKYVMAFGNYSSSLQDILASDNQIEKESQLKEQSNFLLDKDGNLIINGDNEIGGNVDVTGTFTLGNIKIGYRENTDYSGYSIWVTDGTLGGIGEWAIDENGDARFENVTIDGTIKTSRFKWNEIQTSSGIIIVRPSSKIKSIKLLEDNTYEIELEDAIALNIDDYFLIQGTGKNSRKRAYGFINSINNENSNIFIVENIYINEDFLSIYEAEKIDENTNEIYDFKNGTFLNYGHENDTGIVINSEKDIMLDIPEHSITFFTNVASEKNSGYKRKNNLIIGDLSSLGNLNNYRIGGQYGLYADNAILSGAVVSIGKTTDKTYTAGFSSLIKGEENVNPEDVVLWAGVDEDDFTTLRDGSFDDLLADKKKYPFIVSRDGRLSASGGNFEGSVITDSVFTGKISGEDGLIIETDKNEGVVFSNSSNIPILINENGLRIFAESDLEIYSQKLLDEMAKEEPFKSIIENSKTNILETIEEIVKETTKDDWENLIRTFIPYAFSNDEYRSINSEKFTTFNYNEENEAFEANGLFIEKNIISYKNNSLSFDINGSNTPNDTNDNDYRSLYRTWMEEESFQTIKLNKDSIDFYSASDENNKTSIIGSLLKNIKVETDISWMKKEIHLGKSEIGIIFEPHEVNGIQDGFDLFIEEI